MLRGLLLSGSVRNRSVSIRSRRVLNRRSDPLRNEFSLKPERSRNKDWLKNNFFSSCVRFFRNVKDHVGLGIDVVGNDFFVSSNRSGPHIVVEHIIVGDVLDVTGTLVRSFVHPVTNSLEFEGLRSGSFKVLWLWFGVVV